MEYKLALLGSPVKHSRSKALQEGWLKENGFSGSYELINTTEETLQETVNRLKEEGYAGFNITMPCKLAMAKICDVLIDRAYDTKSVNTVKIEDGDFIGCNTDGAGMARALINHGAVIEGSTVAMFGKGGAARAIGAELQFRGAKVIYVLTRNTSDANIKETLEEADIIINATPTGMIVNGETVMWISKETGEKRPSAIPTDTVLRPEQIVADAVYNPEETSFIKQAKSSGCEVIYGLEMLVEQGKEAFQIWTGKQI